MQVFFCLDSDFQKCSSSKNQLGKMNVIILRKASRCLKAFQTERRAVYHAIYLLSGIKYFVILASTLNMGSHFQACYSIFAYKIE